MKMRAFLSMLLLSILMTATAGNRPGDTKVIQGAWIPTKAELGGIGMGSDTLKIITLKIDDGKYEVTAEVVDKGTYTMNPDATPKTIDITGVEGPNAGKKILAIYELKGDTLRICYNLGPGPRPTEFQSPVGSTHFLATYKRKKADPIPPAAN